MSQPEYFPPTYGQGEFHCPHCNVYAKQFYSHLVTNNRFSWRSVVDRNSKFDEVLSSDWVISKCQRCGEHIIWYKENIIHPKKMGPQGYLWVKTPDSAAGLRVDSPWISLCHPWLRERVDNPWKVRSSHATGVPH